MSKKSRQAKNKAEHQLKREKNALAKNNTPPPAIRTQQITEFSQRVNIHQGPLPPPEMLREYDSIVPGAAGRIITLLEEQTHHRHALESTVINADNKRAYLGLGAGFVIALVIALGGLYVATFNPWAGVAMSSGSLGSLVGVFVYGSQLRRGEREAKAKLTAGEPPP